MENRVSFNSQIQDDDEICRKAEDRIYSFASEKRVRLEDFFAQFDRLRCRHVTAAQFQRALTLTGASVTPVEVNALIKKYTDRETPGVHYRLFCDNVLKIERDLEKRPLDLPQAAYSPAKKTETLNPALEKEFTFGLMPKLKKWVKERGLILKDYFSDFDPHRNGRVTKTQFRRCLPFDISEHEVDILVAKYEDVVVGDVNYRQLHADLMDGKAFVGLAEPTVIRRKPLRLLGEMEKEVKVFIRDKRVRLYDFFEDFDKLRSGFVTKSIFQRVLSMVGLEALRDRLELLSEIYAKPSTGGGYPEMIDYVAFCRHMEAEPKSYHELLHSVVGRMRKEFSARGPTGLQGLITSLRESDDRGRGKLGPSEFIWALTSCGLRATHEEVFALLDYFDVNNEGVVNYEMFLDAIRGDLPPSRRRVAMEVFRTIDVENAGEVWMADILNRFDPHHHPSVISGEVDPESIVDELSSSMPHSADGPGGTRVTFDGFCKFFSMVSANLAHDEHFEQLLWDFFGGRPASRQERSLSGSRQPWASPLRSTARMH